MRFWFFLLITLSFSLAGQLTIIDSIYEDESEEVLLNRKRALHFSQKLHKFSEPSLVSIHMMDFTWNQNPEAQKKSYMLNTTIQPVLSLGGKHWYFGKFIHTLQAVPSITIRVLSNDSLQRDHSLPVRTPSFIARFSYFLSHQKCFNDSNTVNWYFGLNAYHHSNGQDGYEFVYPTYQINTYNGNFSEPLVLEPMLAGFVQFNTPKKGTEIKTKGLRSIQKQKNHFNIYWKLSFEYHPKPFTSPRFYEHQLYGRKRVNLNLGYLYAPFSRDIICKRKRCWLAADKEFYPVEVRRFILNASYIVDGQYYSGALGNLESVKLLSVRKRLNVDLTWYERIGSKNDYAIFLRTGYYGSDPYNIYFQQSIFIARMGIAFGVFSASEKNK
jgi:hypothetical protein